MAEPAQHPLQPTHHRPFSCVLKASIHCEGCKRKVKKILTQLQGVESVDVDTKQQKVTVTGTVDADTLIKKLAKSGKHAQLWPQNPPKIDTNNVVVSNKEKKINESKTSTQIDHQQQNPTSVNANPKHSKEVKHVDGDDGANGVTADQGSSEASQVASTMTTATAAITKETKEEDKKNDEEKRSSAPEPPQKEAAEKSIGREGSGTPGKKKKKKGQSGNHSNNSEAVAPPPAGAENRVPGPPPTTNQIPPYNPHYPPPPHYYSGPSVNAPWGAPTMGPPTQPAYVVSYNAAYPSYTAAYYSTQPPSSYAYMHPGHAPQQPPSDPELNIPRQPLDSFEIFSDENPNGCYVM